MSDLDEILQAHDEKIKQASKRYDGYPVSKSRRELKQALEAYITEREQEAYKEGYIDGGIAEMTR